MMSQKVVNNKGELADVCYKAISLTKCVYLIHNSYVQIMLKAMKTTAESAVKVDVIPRTITKKALRCYFNLTPRRFKRLVPDELRNKMGLTAETDRYLEEYNIYQTKVFT